MTSALVARNRHLGLAALLHQVGQKRRRQKRHVAPYHQNLLRERLHQRRVQTAQRTRPGDAVNDRPDVPRRGTLDLRPRPLAHDDQDVWGEAANERQLPIQNGGRADDERAFIDTAEPPRFASGKNGCCPGNDPLDHD